MGIEHDITFSSFAAPSNFCLSALSLWQNRVGESRAVMAPSKKKVFALVILVTR